jgi:hypothetical protein
MTASAGLPRVTYALAAAIVAVFNVDAHPRIGGDLAD